jgi:hypothetical protein
MCEAHEMRSEAKQNICVAYKQSVAKLCEAKRKAEGLSDWYNLKRGGRDFLKK